MNFPAAALEAFQILRSYNYKVVLYDEEGNQVYEPDQARRFFVKPENLLVSIIDDGEDSSTRVYLSKDTDISSVQGLCDALRAMSSKYKMIFHLKKRNRILAPKDFATGAAVAESILYGTSKTSYMTLGESQIVIKHSRTLTENTQAARKENINAITIVHQNRAMDFPGTYLLPAQAMATHIDNGGNLADQIGQYIIQAANELSTIKPFSKQKGRIVETLETIFRNYDQATITPIVKESSKTLCPMFEDYSEWLNNFGNDSDDDALTMADVILPTNQGADFENEVDAPTAADPSEQSEMEPDLTYINKLSSISGFR